MEDQHGHIHMHTSADFKPKHMIQWAKHALL